MDSNDVTAEIKIHRCQPAQPATAGVKKAKGQKNAANGTLANADSAWGSDE